MACSEESNNYWSYDNPAEWSKHFPCAGGSSQSPIDINTNETVSESFPLFVFSSKYNSNEIFKLINNGHQVAATLADHTYGQSEKDLWFTGGGLTGQFYFVNFHLHWGNNDRHGSEHEIDGYRFPAEAHFVFKNNESGQLAVFSLLFTIADQWDNENTEWEKYADAASQLKNANDTIKGTPPFPEQKKFFFRFFDFYFQRCIKVYSIRAVKIRSLPSRIVREKANFRRGVPQEKKFFFSR
jgi:carbonic anhydrase